MLSHRNRFNSTCKFLSLRLRVPLYHCYDTMHAPFAIAAQTCFLAFHLRFQFTQPHNRTPSHSQRKHPLRRFIYLFSYIIFFYWRLGSLAFSSYAKFSTFRFILLFPHPNCFSLRLAQGPPSSTYHQCVTRVEHVLNTCLTPSCARGLHCSITDHVHVYIIERGKPPQTLVSYCHIAHLLDWLNQSLDTQWIDSNINCTVLYTVLQSHFTPEDGLLYTVKMYTVIWYCISIFCIIRCMPTKNIIVFRLLFLW